MKIFTTKELGEIIKVSEKTILRDLSAFGDKTNFLINGKYSIPYDIADKIAVSRGVGHLPTFADIADIQGQEEEIEQSFTLEEYSTFMKVIEEYPVLKNELKNSEKSIVQYLETIDILKNQLEYFQFSYNKQLEIHEQLIRTFNQRNFIEAKEKGFDNE